jgi:hypothetical protein
MGGENEKILSKSPAGMNSLNLREGKEKFSSKSSVGNDPPNAVIRSTMSEHMRHKTMRSKGPSKKHLPRVRSLYILVMGLTGAGKSTFISTVTENPGILVGSAEDLEGGTRVLLPRAAYFI